MKRLRHAGRVLVDLAVAVAVHVRLIRWPEDKEKR